jgi:hypothetical protein
MITSRVGNFSGKHYHLGGAKGISEETRHNRVVIRSASRLGEGAIIVPNSARHSVVSADVVIGKNARNGHVIGSRSTRVRKRL